MDVLCATRKKDIYLQLCACFNVRKVLGHFGTSVEFTVQCIVHARE